MSWIDIAIIVLVVLCGLIGLLKGFKKSLLSLGAFLVAFLLAFFLSNVIAEALLGVDAIKGFVLGSGTFAEGEISLANIIYGGLGENNGGISPESFLGQHFFAPITEIISKSTVDLSPDKGQAMYMAFLMFSAICGVGIFLIVRFLLMIVTAIIKSYIGKKKSVGSRLFGFLISAVQGAVMAFAVTIIFTNFGGLTFMPAINAVENEYESSTAVLATPVYEGAYAIRNKLLLPNEEMYGRIVNLVIKKDYENPDTEHLTGDRLQLFIDINNINYDNEPWSVDETTRKRKFDSENAVARDASEFAIVGYDNVVKAILDYNIAAAKIVDDAQKYLVDENYKNFNDTYIKPLAADIDSLIGYLRAYIEDYKTFGNTTDPIELESNNLTLGDDYKRINDRLTVIHSRYKQLENSFADITVPDFEPLIPERVNAGEYKQEDPPPEQGGDDENKGENLPPEQGGENGGGENEGENGEQGGNENGGNENNNYAPQEPEV